MKRDSSALREVGEALFGPQWQTPLADRLSVADRTVRRWVGGEFAIPDGIWAELAKLCRSSAAELERLADKLER